MNIQKNSQSIKVSRLLHAGYLFESQKAKILFDPIFETPFSRNCYSYPEVRFDRETIKKYQFTAVFISHYHDDHCSLESLNLIDRNTPIYIYCVHKELFNWLHCLGFTKVTAIKLNSHIQIEDICITPTQALDVFVDCVFQIEYDGIKILNVVDSWIAPDTLKELSKKSPWDLVLWPFQTFREIEILSPSRYNLFAKGEIPTEFAEQIQQLHPRIIVPSACQFQFENQSWLNQVYFPVTYADFSNFINSINANSHVVRIEPSESYELTQKSFKKIGSVKGIELLQNEFVEYGVSDRFVIPKTSAIAQMFPALEENQKNLISDYCKKTLPHEYQKLNDRDIPYFENECIWRLTLYSADGISIDHYYRVSNSYVTQTNDTPSVFHWWTEIPETRLYGAITDGESLSSLYVRINDFLFAPEIEHKLKDFDPLWDPLLRCLYNNNFGSYQKAQLQRILDKHSSIVI